MAIKKSILLACSSSSLLFVAACGGNSDEKKAEKLYSQAEQAAKTGNYEAAINLLDSMDRSCPSAVDIRRKGMALRPQLIEQQVNRQIEITDSISAIDSYRLDSLSKLTLLVRNPIENYYVPTVEGHVNVGSVSGLHGRMAPDGRIYIVATSQKPLQTIKIMVTSDGQSAETPAVSFDGERNDRSSGKDVITFIEGECQEVVKFIYEHRLSPITVTFTGNGAASMTLPDNQKEGIASLYEVSTLVRERKKQELEKQKLEKMLEVARSQTARTIQDPE